MDLRAYYQRIREIEAGIPDAEVVVITRATGDGGRRGQRTEVRRAVAARMVVDGKVDLASPEESEQFRRAVAQKRDDLQGIVPGMSARDAGLLDAGIGAVGSGRQRRKG